MSRVDIINQLYRKMSRREMTDFDKLQPPPPLPYFFNQADIMELKRIATSNKLAARPAEKYKLIDQVMRTRNFKKLASGTNRVVYKYMEDQSFVVKTAIDSVGMSDTPNEFFNQQYLKPFCTRVYDMSPCGTVGQFERINPISSLEEFLSVADDIYTIIVNHFVGRYVLDDFGTNYYQNWGVRIGAHPVICDFPYTFKLDGAKLVCNKPDLSSEFGFCGGEIDYDDGFNNLICTKCGKHYNARDLKKSVEGIENGILITDKKGEIPMKVIIRKGNELVQSVDSEKSATSYKRTRVDKRTGEVVPKKTPYEYRQEKRIPVINVKVTGSEEKILDETPVTTIPQDFEAHDLSKLKEIVTEKPEEPKHEEKKEESKVYIDSSKFNQKTSVKDQRIENFISKSEVEEPVDEVETHEQDTIEPETEAEEIDGAESLANTLIDNMLAKISGDDPDMELDHTEQLYPLNEDDLSNQEKPKVESERDPALDEY